MTFKLEERLREGLLGREIDRAARNGGWSSGSGEGEYTIHHDVDKTQLTARWIPCPAGSWTFCLESFDQTNGKTSNSRIPAEAVISQRVLLEGPDGTSNCPHGVTLVAGDLLLSEAKTAEKLCSLILDQWDWWLSIRQKTRELTIAWSSPPGVDIVMLFNMLDAGNLPEPFEQPLAAGRVNRLVGWHPITNLAAKAAGISSEGCVRQADLTLVNRRGLLSERFWRHLGESCSFDR
jgi:hypothetical protein